MLKGRRIKAYLKDSEEGQEAPCNEKEAMEESIAHGQGQTSDMEVIEQLVKIRSEDRMGQTCRRSILKIWQVCQSK